MKVLKVTEDSWNIMFGGKVVGEIVERWGWKSIIKMLRISDNDLGRVSNQKEAIDKTKEFFAMNKEEIHVLKGKIKELELGISQLPYQVCINVLSVEKDRLSESLKVLESYDALL